MTLKLVHSNIDESYRRGVEIETNLKLSRKLNWSEILLFLKKIKAHSEYIDNWDTWGKDTINYKTPISHFLQI